jgi:protein-tyrosine sulfotransferase
MRHFLNTLLLKHPKLQISAHRAYGVAHSAMYSCVAPKIRSNEEFLFIVGCGRSGNTLLRRLLVERLQIYIPSETYVLGASLSAFIKSHSFRWEDRVNVVLSSFEYHPEYPTMCQAGLREVANRCKDLPPEERTYGNIIILLYRFFAEETGCEYQLLGDKTPTNTYSLGMLNAAFPASKFLFISRDPYDVVSSYLKMGRYATATAAANRWVEAHLAWAVFSRQIANSRTKELSYELLVQDTQDTIFDIGSWLQVSARQTDLPSDFFWGDIDQRSHHSNVMKTTNKSSIGRGQKELSQAQIQEVSAVIGNVLNLARQG